MSDRCSSARKLMLNTEQGLLNADHSRLFGLGLAADFQEQPVGFAEPRSFFQCLKHVAFGRGIATLVQQARQMKRSGHPRMD